MSDHTIRLVADRGEYYDQLSILERAASVFPDKRGLINTFLRSVNEAEVTYLDSDDRATDAGDLTVRVKPTDSFRNFVAAVSAGNFNDPAVSFYVHKEPLS